MLPTIGRCCLSASSAAVKLLDGEPQCELLSLMLMLSGIFHTA